MAKVAVNSDWKTEPMPEKYTTIDINIEYCKDDMTKIRAGFIPQAMEEKWFTYFEDIENKLYMHRSWTGYCIYIVTFEEKGDKFVAKMAKVNRDPSQCQCTSDEEDKEIIEYIIGAQIRKATSRRQ